MTDTPKPSPALLLLLVFSRCAASFGCVFFFVCASCELEAKSEEKNANAPVASCFGALACGLAAPLRVDE
eukprot:3052242-Rhodomonas_salina.1